MTVSPVNPLFPNMPDWQQQATENLWPPYTQMLTTPIGLPVTEAEGVRIKLADGRILIDGVSSWWSVCHGYRHPHIEQAVISQLQKLPHIMLGGYQHEPAALLARRLADICPSELNHVFFTDSGSVAIEVGMKMAIQFWLNNGVKGRHKFIHFRGGYHGDTFATMAVCDPEEGMHSHFSGVLTPQILAELPVNDEFYELLDKQMASHADEVAGLLIEPLVQGAGGMNFYAPEYLKQVRALCSQHDVLLIADEIATGFGRTGKLFACEWANISPDIMCLGKSLTGGYMTLAATLCTDKVSHGICDGEAGCFMHGPTFMGNPLACSVANASIDLLLMDDWATNVDRIASILAQQIEPFKGLTEVADTRVLGAIGVIEMKEPVNLVDIQRQFVSQGIWVRPFGKLIYVMPPFIISDDELEQLMKRIYSVLKKKSKVSG